MEDTESVNTTEDDDNTIITTNMNRSLKRVLDIPLSDEENENDQSVIAWSPPKIYGLSNSRRIIHPHFIKHNGILSKIDYIDVIKDNIRNMRPLTKYELEYIKTLSRYELLELFEIIECVNQQILKCYVLSDDDNG